MSFVLKLKDVSKSFGQQRILNPISFEVGKGERICILGPSGCGKSTLLQIVAGLLRADGGEVSIMGKTVENGSLYIPPEKRPINMVFQDYALWPHMTVKQNIEYGMKRRKTEAAVMNERLQRLQALLRLEGLMERLPAQLSGGQQQRVGIARAIATEPDLLLMDEPLSNLDVKLRTDMRNELARLLGELSIASLYVTHDRMEAFTLADRILVLRNGNIEQLAEPRELFEKPATPWVAQLMGYHNRLTGYLAEGGAPGAHLAGSRISGTVMATGSGKGEAIIMLHPESIFVCEVSDVEKGNCLPVKVVQCIYEGTCWRLIVETKDGQPVHVFHDRRVETGEWLELFLQPERAMIYANSSGAVDG
ncbi:MULTISPECIES: ABC transporter ATP-binding protein [unclassified Paenibacillus]|uniref:ABC transporter ATP-binding protein n=1 Tax=unclassified Paenibacillus TaxID=185978 RepID=UPI003645DF76